MAKRKKANTQPQQAQRHVRTTCGKAMIADAEILGLIYNHTKTYLHMSQQIHSLQEPERRVVANALGDIESAQKRLMLVGKRAQSGKFYS